MYSPVRVYFLIGTTVGISETFVERSVVYCFFVTIEVPVNLNFHLCCKQAACGSVKLWAEAAAGRKVVEVSVENRKMA